MNKLQDNAPPQRRAPSDVFRPRLPLDPFAPAQLTQLRDEENENVDPDAPWTAHDFANRAAAYALGPHVLLVLGAPHAHAVAPILRSPTFARSLLLFLTHAPPPLSAFIAAAAPNGLCPAIKILRLATPLDPAAPVFALTLVHILDAAADVSRAWRASLSSSNAYPQDIEQLAQDANGAFTLPEPLAPESPPVSLPVSEHLHPASAAAAPARRSRLASGPSSYAPGSTSTRTSPARPRPKSALSLTSTGFFSPPASPTSASPSGPSKRNSLTKPPPPASAHTTPSKRSSALLSSKRASSSSSSSSFSSASGKGKGKPRPASTTLGHKDPSRPFDALLSFLPPSQPERAVLKQVVLTSTLAGAFVSGRPWAGACGEAESQGGVGGFEWGATSSSAPPSPSYARGYPYSSYSDESRPGSAGASTSRPASVFAPGAGASRPGSFVGGGGGDFLPASAPASTRSRSKSRSRFSFLFGGGGGEGSSKSVPGSRRSSFLGAAYGSASASASASVSVATLGVGFNYSSSTLGLGASVNPGYDACGGAGTSATGRAHIIHVLPASYRSTKLTGALDAFLRSYAPSAPPASYSSGSSSAHSYSHSHSHSHSHHSHHSHTGGGETGRGQGAGQGPKAYVLAERALRDVECVLVGALEGPVSSSDAYEEASFGVREEGDGGKGKERADVYANGGNGNGNGKEGRRRRGAWVAGVVRVRRPSGALTLLTGVATDGGAPSGEAEVDADPRAREEEAAALELEQDEPLSDAHAHHPDAHADARAPYGLPTPPASRSGSGEGPSGDGDPSVEGGEGDPSVEGASASVEESSAHTHSTNATHGRTPSKSSANGHGHGRTPSTSSTSNGKGQGKGRGKGKLRRASVRGAPSSPSPPSSPTLIGAVSMGADASPPTPTRRRVDSAPSGSPAPPNANGHAKQPGENEAEAEAEAEGEEEDESPTPKITQKEKAQTIRGGRFFGGKGSEPGGFGLASAAPITAAAAAPPPPTGSARRGTAKAKESARTWSPSAPDLRVAGVGGGGGEKERERERDSKGRRKRWWAFWG